MNDSLRKLTEKNELADAIKGGGTVHQTTKTTNGFVTSSNASMRSPPSEQMQRAFLQSAMVQNLQIQQQLLAQNQALQTLLSQQEPNQIQSSSQQSPIHKATAISKGRVSSSPFAENDRIRKSSSSFENNSHIPPPPPPPMPPPIEFHDPSGARPFLDPYGRAKTVNTTIIRIYTIS